MDWANDAHLPLATSLALKEVVIRVARHCGNQNWALTPRGSFKRRPQRSFAGTVALDGPAVMVACAFLALTAGTLTDVLSYSEPQLNDVVDEPSRAEAVVW
jgi:hypothetical protein